MSAAWSRRRVLGATLGVAGASCLAGFAPRARAADAVAAATAGARLVVIQDGRFATSRHHATGLAPQAYRVVDARDDLARLWYGGLAREAAGGALAFAGITTWSDYVVFAGCAAEAGLRRSTHAMMPDAGGAGCTLVRWQIERAPA